MKESEKFLKINGIEVFWDNISDNYNLIQVHSSKNRTFCRCGAVHTNNVWTCPFCLKSGVYYNYSSGRGNLDVPRIETTPSGFEILNDSYAIVENTSTNEYDVVSTLGASKVAVKDSHGINFLGLSSYSRFASVCDIISNISIDFEDLKKLDSSYLSDFENFNAKAFMSTCHSYTNRYSYGANNKLLTADNKSAMYLLFCMLKKAFDWLGDDGSFHEAFLGYIFQSVFEDRTKIFARSYDKMLTELGFPNDWKPFTEKSWFLDNLNYYGQIKVKTQYDLLDDSYKEFLLDSVDHYHFSLSTLSDLTGAIVTNIGNGTLDNKVSPVFEKFCKDNLISYQGAIVNHFVNDSNELLQRKLKVTSDNLRELPLIKNKEQFEEMGYDVGRTNVFLESFFDNPLKASYYLKSKKALTKKEMNEFIEKQTK
mgnify:CR=1 FL=1